MTKEEYIRQVTIIESECERAKSKLKWECARSNNPYKVGDIIEDHLGKGKIIEMSMDYRVSDGFPLMSYYVQELCKNGSPKKRKTYRRICQSNVK